MPDSVLIVDDDFDLATAVQMALEAYGYATTIASNGRDALDAVRVDMPSIIILDMMMPIMNGWEFAREFNAKYGRAAPILVLTAAENAKARAAEIDADGVISKPFDTKKLIAAVRSVAEQHATHA